MYIMCTGILALPSPVHLSYLIIFVSSYDENCEGSIYNCGISVLTCVFILNWHLLHRETRDHERAQDLK